MLMRTLLSMCLFSMAAAVFAHQDDPKFLDRKPRYEGPAFRAVWDGRAGETFESMNVTLMSWLPLGEFGNFSSGNDCWGYVSKTGREYAIMGLRAATGFVDITNPGDAQIVAVVPGPSSLWRDIKTYDEYCYAVNESSGGIQVMDLTAIDDGIVTVANTVDGQGPGDTHNVFINEDSGYLYRLGGPNKGLRIYSLADPVNPQYVGEWPDRYVHDAQIITYHTGPYAGREIAFCNAGLNGGWVNTGLSIVDVTDKSNIFVITHFQYPQAGYSHQGFLSEDRHYFYVNDELDEQNLDILTTTHVIDVSDLANPAQVSTFSSGSTAIDHNLYVRGDMIFQANYRSGLRVFKATDPEHPVQVGFFDTWPNDDNASFNGLWSNYPFFPSGTIIGSDLERGLFVWRFGTDPFDLTEDGHVDLEDLRIQCDEWPACGDSCEGDFDGDGRISCADMVRLVNRMPPR